MNNLKNPGRRNIRFLLQILVIVLLVAAAVAAKAENLRVQNADCSFTENGRHVKSEFQIGSSEISPFKIQLIYLLFLQGAGLVVVR